MIRPFVTNDAPAVQVTFLISTYNRRETLLQTLRQLRPVEQFCGHPIQTIVVDNASTDGTSDAITHEFPDVLLLRQNTNRGACAKNAGLPLATGRYIVFLDDDSYPTADSIGPMIDCFHANPKLGAAIFDVILPDGSRECSAYPSVFIGCGTAFRREALEQTGGLPEDFFMQAEEYDLSLRLMDRGWIIQRFKQLRVHHLKTPGSRILTRTMRLDTRNNLMVVMRHFPRQWVIPFALDWMRRYHWIAQSKGWRYRFAYWRGLAEGIVRSYLPGHRKAVSPETFEQFAMIGQIKSRLEAVTRGSNIRLVLFIDVGKNILPFWLAARYCGLRIVAIADVRLAKPGRQYRGVPVVDDAAARAMPFHAAIIANVSPVHAAARYKAWRDSDSRPVINLFESTAANDCVSNNRTSFAA